MTWRRDDRGAVAVEFAFVLPLILILVFGIIDFGRILMAQISLTQAAREGVRLAAVGRPSGEVSARVSDAGLPLTVTVGSATYCPSPPTATSRASITSTHTFTFVTPIGAMAGIFGGAGPGGSIVLTGQAVMRCGA